MIPEDFAKLFREVNKVSKSLVKVTGKTANALVLGKKLITEKKTAQERLDICQTCPYLNKKYRVCEVCGCFAAAKVKLDYEECPKCKW